MAKEMVSCMADMNQVLQKLVERTKEKRVAWRNSSQSGAFRASIGHLTIYIIGYQTTMGEAIYLSVMDRNGQTVGSEFYESSKPRPNSDLVSLYEEAKRIATDDPRLDELLEALDAAPTIS